MSVASRLTLAGAAVALAGGVIAAPPASAAPLSLATTASTVTVSLDGRSFSARLVRPTQAGTYPVVAFGHGFSQTSSPYAGTLTALAARGYIVIAPNSESGLAPSHSRFADDLQRSLRWARANVAGASPTADAVAGHSMGGGAALVAADRYPEIDTVVTLAAAETTPSATTASSGTTVPALYIVGSRDTIVPPSTTLRMYTVKPSPAVFASITGGSHCGFLDSSPFLGIGCDRASITRAAQLSVTRGLMGDWLDARFRSATEPADRSGVVFTRK